MQWESFDRSFGYVVDEGFERLVDPIQVVVMEASCVVNVSVCMLVNKQ